MKNRMLFSQFAAVLASATSITVAALAFNPGLLEPSSSKLLVSSAENIEPQTKIPAIKMSAGQPAIEEQPEADEVTLVEPSASSDFQDPSEKPQSVAVQPELQKVCAPGNPMRTQAIHHRELGDLAYDRDRNLAEALFLYQQAQQDFRAAQCPQAAEQVQWGIDKVSREMEVAVASGVSGGARGGSGEPGEPGELEIEKRCVEGNPVRSQAIMIREQGDIAYDQERDLPKALHHYRIAQREFYRAGCLTAVKQTQAGIETVEQKIKEIEKANRL